MESGRKFLKLAGVGVFAGSMLPFISIAGSAMSDLSFTKTFKLGIRLKFK